MLIKCKKCRIENERCIYGCPYKEVYIKGAVGSDQPGVTVITDKEYDELAKLCQKEAYGAGFGKQ